MFEPRDLWVGVFWDRRKDGLHVYVCLLPTIVLHLVWDAKDPVRQPPVAEQTETARTTITRREFRADPGRYILAADQGPITVVDDAGRTRMVLSSAPHGSQPDLHSANIEDEEAREMVDMAVYVLLVAQGEVRPAERRVIALCALASESGDVDTARQIASDLLTHADALILKDTSDGA